jgi:peptidyl-prolyl cis-trans isomerase SurA
MAALQCWIWAATVFAETELVDRIVAIVNDDVISLYDLEQAMKPYRRQIEELGYGTDQERRMLFKLREDLLNQLINEKLTDQEVKKYEISISEEEIDRYLENLKKTNYLTDEQLQDALAKEGMALDDYRNAVKERMLRTRLLNRQVRSKIVITEEEIRAYYDSHKDQYAGEKKYHLKHIIIRVSAVAGSGQRAAARDQMQAILERFKAGESFAALADRYSDPDLTLKGGELGVFAFDSLSPKIQDAVEDLSEGDITAVIESEQGFQIFLVERIESMPSRTYEEAAQEIEDKLAEEIIDTRFDEWLEDLRARSHVKIIM